MSLSQEELEIIKWHVPLFSTHGRTGCTIMDTYWSFPNIHMYTNVCPSRVAETFSDSNMPNMIRISTEQKKYPKCDWAIKFDILVWSKNILPRGLHVLAPPSCLKNLLDESKNQGRTRENRWCVRSSVSVWHLQVALWIQDQTDSLQKNPPWVAFKAC